MTCELPQSPSPTKQREAGELAKRLRITTTFAHLLLSRGFGDDESTRAFLDPKLASLTPPDDMADRDSAIDRIVHAITHHQRVVIFGDYDCDGITSTAILTELIRMLGGEVEPLIGNRFEGGYGLSEAGADRVLAAGPALLITCDCGSSDHERLERLRRQGIDAVVIDHHLVPDEPLPATAFLNPRRPDCGFPYKNLASCGLALNLAAGIRKVLKPELDVRQWLDLVAIGTVADMVELDGDNRALVRAGMKRLVAAERPGIRALGEVGKLGLRTSVSAETISFGIAPRLNAPGRLGDASLSLKLLLERDPNTARGLANTIEQVKRERQEIQARVLQEASSQIEREGFDKDPALVVGDEGWHPGVVGIVAAQLVERYGKPAIVIGFSEGTGRGSVRGTGGCSVYEMLEHAAAPDVHFGGHHAAAGVTLASPEALTGLRESFCAAAVALGDEQRRTSKPGADVLLDTQDVPFDVVRDFDWLEPCGVGNPAPVVAISDALVVRSKSVTGGHLQLTVEDSNGRKIHGFMAGAGYRAEQLVLGKRVNVVGSLGRDNYWGGDAVAMKIKCVDAI